MPNLVAWMRSCGYMFPSKAELGTTSAILVSILGFRYMLLGDYGETGVASILSGCDFGSIPGTEVFGQNPGCLMFLPWRHIWDPWIDLED